MTPRSSPHRDAYPEDEDYVGYALTWLLQSRLRTQEARKHQQYAQGELNARLEAALEGEKAMMSEFEDYLSEALLWREQQTGQAHLAHALGTLRLQEAPPLLALHDLPQLQAWLRHLQEQLLALSLALPGAGATRTQTADAALAALGAFYEHTGLVPPGTQLQPRPRQVVLD